ncbi:MAG: DUF3866 family protein [Armatimonadota bacterium]|nr:DUF3866 family protein [Armatimonadota bacterium]MCX7777325.1 DUF3866 family protein [Armatimonadota bacterium]MDW8024357.1 DUF3866 family protein [Armatimonadota bacterium]
MRRFEIGEVEGILAEHSDAQVLAVRINSTGECENAFNYIALTGRAMIGDAVLLNTCAIKLGLGTGGYHFVVANLTHPTDVEMLQGHIVKMRYSPHQINTLSVEAQESEYHELVKACESIDGMPVIVGQLHSMLVAAAAGFKATYGMDSKVAYVMTDSAALLLAFSDLVRVLKSKGIIDVTITTGQAFGGDIESVNIFTGLIAARHIADADLAIVTPGPGHVGTATKFGFSGIEVGWAVEIANALNGATIFIPRVSFAESRGRHLGLSHHTITVLTYATNVSVTICFHDCAGDERGLLEMQLDATGIRQRHRIVWEDGTPGIELAKRLSLPLMSMGRSYEDDPQYFLTASAAGVYAAKLFTLT